MVGIRFLHTHYLDIYLRNQSYDTIAIIYHSYLVDQNI